MLFAGLDFGVVPAACPALSPAACAQHARATANAS
jgi:hypothetical protein